MPILDKMNQNNTPDDDNQNGNSNFSFDDIPLDQPVRKRPGPKFVESRDGRRQITVAALLERIVDQFHAENTPDETALRAAKTRADRAKLLLPVVEYILGVESVMLEDSGKAEIMRLAYSEIFEFGPLDAFINDDTVTTVTIEGIEKVSVRHGQGELEPVDMIFDDEVHLKDIAGRMLKRAGAALREDMPIVEAGFKAESGRFVSMSMASAAVAYALNLDIRLHPAEPPTIDTLIERETLTEEAAQLLRALMQSHYGFTLVGQPESGKTMTLSALLSELPNPDKAIAVERTGELHLPEGMARAVVQWPEQIGDEGVTFGEQIEAHAEQLYDVMVLDEVRADEPHSIAPLLSMSNPPRLIWSFRGAPDSKRMMSALGMLARRSNTGLGDEMVSNLFARMPFVVSVRRLNEKIELREVGEWYYPDDLEFVQYHALMQTSGGETFLTGEKPSHALPGLDDSFWEVE